MQLLSAIGRDCKQMSNYKYYIRTRNGCYYFGLYPNNNNQQAIAISGDYSSYKDAKEGICKLKQMLQSSSDLFSSYKGEDGYYFELKPNKDGLVFHRDLALTHHYEIAKCIKRIYVNYDAPLRVE